MFSLPTWVAKTFSTMWDRNDGNIHPCLVPTFQVEAVWFFTLSVMLALELFTDTDAFYQNEEMSVYL